MNTIQIKILKIQKFLIVQWGFLWILWMSHLLAHYRSSNMFEQWKQAKAYWKFWNADYHSNIRYTPLELYSMIVNNDYGPD